MSERGPTRRDFAPPVPLTARERIGVSSYKSRVKGVRCPKCRRSLSIPLARHYEIQPWCWNDNQELKIPEGVVLEASSD